MECAKSCILSDKFAIAKCGDNNCRWLYERIQKHENKKIWLKIDEYAVIFSHGPHICDIKSFRLRMNAIFDKDDDCCDQTWSYYAHDPRFKNIPVAGLSGLFDNLEECRQCKTDDYGVYIDSTG